MARLHLVLLAPLLLAAAPPDLEGQAESPVIGGNLASARGRALQAAQQDCLSRAVAAQVGAERAAVEAQRIAPLLARAQRFLRNYRVLEEGEQGQRFRVRVACTIDDVQLRRALQGVLGGGLGPAPGASTWELRVTLAPAGGALLVAALADRAALALKRGGVSIGAGGGVLELRVELREEPAVRGLGWPARRATASVMSGPTALGATAQTFGAARTDDEAARLAAERAVDQAVSEALPVLVPATSAAARVEIRARGLTGVNDLQELRRALDELGAGGRLRSVEGREAHLDAAPGGGAGALAAGLRSRAFSRVALVRQQISGGVLWLEFARR